MRRPGTGFRGACLLRQALRHWCGGERRPPIRGRQDAGERALTPKAGPSQQPGNASRCYTYPHCPKKRL
ncbi:MAG: hypothetical protein OXU61_08285 [Gammaproteobacteria bacterium]|nr:hypothetical protein [Gammaproteobacteria bacterium]